MVKTKSNKPFIIVGRAGVDLYADQPDCDLEAVTSFHRYVGGAGANIAVQSARLNSKSILLTKLADDPWGDYIKNYLNSAGVSIAATPAEGCRNSLAVTEIKKESKVLFYRQDPADHHLSPEDVEEKTMSSSAGVILTGTALAGSPSREAALLILFYAGGHGFPVILDLDYRPGFKNAAEVFVYYQTVMEKSDIVIGTEEEFAQVLAFITSRGGPAIKTEEAVADYFLRGKTRLVIIKRGGRGSAAYQRSGGREKGKITSTPGGVFTVQVKKNFGAGDAFAASFCHYYLGGTPLALSLKRAAAAAAIVVSRGTCTEAMPTEAELFDFIKHNRYSIRKNQK